MAYLSFLTLYVSWYGKELEEIIDREKKKKKEMFLRKFRSNQIVAIGISFEGKSNVSSGKKRNFSLKSIQFYRSVNFSFFLNRKLNRNFHSIGGVNLSETARNFQNFSLSRNRNNKRITRAIRLLSVDPLPFRFHDARRRATFPAPRCKW